MLTESVPTVKRVSQLTDRLKSHWVKHLPYLRLNHSFWYQTKSKRHLLFWVGMKTVRDNVHGVIKVQNLIRIKNIYWLFVLFVVTAVSSEDNQHRRLQTTQTLETVRLVLSKLLIDLNKNNNHIWSDIFISSFSGNGHEVFPTGNHTRFEHSIGVMHLGMQYINKLISSISPTFLSFTASVAIEKLRERGVEISDADKLCVMIGGLCHDLGRRNITSL